MFINKRYALQKTLNAQTLVVQNIIKDPAHRVDAVIAPALLALNTLKDQFKTYYQDHWFLGKLVWLFDQIFLHPQSKIVEQIRQLEAVQALEGQGKAPVPLNREQRLWNDELAFICDERNIKLKGENYQNLFESLYRLDRDFALPIDMKKATFCACDPWLKEEILQIVKIPVPVTPEEKWQFSMDMIRRMQRRQAAIAEQRAVYFARHEKPPEELIELGIKFKSNFQARVYDWMCSYKENYKDAQVPKEEVRVQVLAKKVYPWKGVEAPSLPQEFVWNPSSGKFIVHLIYYLKDDGEVEHSFNLNALEEEEGQPIWAYSGCAQVTQPEDDEREEFAKAQAANLPFVREAVEPVFSREIPHPVGGLSLDVMIALVNALSAQQQL